MPKNLLVEITPILGTSTPAPAAVSEETGDFSITISGKQILITPNSPLPNNCELGVTLASGLPALDGDSLADEIDYFYTTSYYPYFSTPTLVRLTEGLGPWIQDVPDDTIWRTILKNSFYAIGAWDNGDSNLTYTNGVPWCVSQFTLYATVLDLMTYWIYVLITSAGSKRLADLSISNNGPSSFQGPISTMREHVVEKFEEFSYLVRIRCTPLEPVTGVRSSSFWEPQPIIDYNLTWKRYPAVDKINSAWAKMYSHSQYNKDLTQIDQAYTRGRLVVPTNNINDFYSWNPKK